MTEKETNIRSVLFLVIGILLLLSLVICIYIVSSESDLVEIKAEILEVENDADGTGKNNVTVVYDVDGTSYKYNFYYEKDVEVGNTLDIYYHSKNVTSVTTFKTSKLIFICPIIGLGLCIFGIFELFRKNDEEKEEFKTSVIGVVGNTQQLKIVTTDETPVKEYVKSPEEEVETQVKVIKKENDAVPIIETEVAKKEEVKEVPVVKEEVKKEEVVPVKEELPKEEKIEKEVEPEKREGPKEEKVLKEAETEEVKVAATESKEDKEKDKEEVEAPKVEEKVEQKDKIEEAELPTFKELKVEEAELPKEVKTEENKGAPKATVSSGAATSSALLNELEQVKTPDVKVEDELVKKVQDNIGVGKDSSNSKELDEDDIKKVIKDVLKEVIQEVNVEKASEKKVEQKKVLPNYYYISGTSLIYEEPGKEAKEIGLKTIKSVVRTVNSAGSVVKLVVSNDEIKCILTNMKNIDLEQVANLLHNKMRIIDQSFEEKIEHKEY